MANPSLRIPVFSAAGLFLLCQGVSPANWPPAFQNLPRPVIQLAPARPWIALTFDDGPHPKMTERLLAVLEQEKVPATFFVVGKMAERYPYLVQEIAAAGHEVSNHTYNHFRFSLLSPPEALAELAHTREVIRRLTGKDTTYYRPPGGRFSERIAKAAAQAGYHMVLWSTLTKDVEGASTLAITQRILKGAQDGDIVLMHSGVPNTLDALPNVISTLKAEGYQFVTVSTLSSRLPTTPAPVRTSSPLAHVPAPRVVSLSSD
jgi:peptidoglycan-N-acetylglucosamine deacetylase